MVGWGSLCGEVRRGERLLYGVSVQPWNGEDVVAVELPYVIPLNMGRFNNQWTFLNFPNKMRLPLSSLSTLLLRDEYKRLSFSNKFLCCWCLHSLSSRCRFNLLLLDKISKSYSEIILINLLHSYCEIAILSKAIQRPSGDISQKQRTANYPII